MKKSLIKSLYWLFITPTLLSALPSTCKSSEGHFKAAGFFQYWPNFEESSDYLTDVTTGALIDIRLKKQWSAKTDPKWQFKMDYNFQANQSETVRQKRLLNSSDTYFFNLDQNQLFNLSHVITNQNNQFIYHRLDRLSASYSTTDFTVKFGRQAITWGNGRLFNPMDRFNPFSPSQVDREYKPGIDMITGENILKSGNELSWLLVPKRDRNTQLLDAQHSAFGVKYFRYGERIDTQYALMKDAQEWLLAMQMTGGIGEGLWNIDWIHAYDTQQQQRKQSLVANYQQAWTWFNRNSHGFIELYFNGYGSDLTKPYLAQLDASLVSKIAENKVFAINQWYLDTGVTIEITPLMTLSPNLIINLQDRSYLVSLQGVYSLTNNDQIILSIQYANGTRGSEFNGLQKTADSPNKLINANQLFLQFNHYF